MRAAATRHINAHGFTLIEMMVALIIMAILGLMAWRGLDGLIRGKERIESHSEQQRDLQYALTLLDRDCQAMVVRDDKLSNPVALGTRSVWWMRYDQQTGLAGWQLVGYRSQADGLYRLISAPFKSRDAALEAWRSLSSSPDAGYGQTEQARLSPHINRQDVTVLSDAPNKTIPIKGLRVIWQFTSNQPGADRPVTRVCLAGGS